MWIAFLIFVDDQEDEVDNNDEADEHPKGVFNHDGFNNEDGVTIISEIPFTKTMKMARKDDNGLDSGSQFWHLAGN